MRVVAVIAAGSLALAAAHCSLTTNLDGFTDGRSDASVVIPPDATPRLVPTNDASITGPDGGVDSGPDDAGFVCPQAALYCNDFGSGTLADISSDVTQNGGTLALDGTLHASMPAHPESGYYAAALSRDLSPTARHAILDVDIDFQNVDFKNAGNVSVISFGIANTPYQAVEIYIDPVSVQTTVTAPNQPYIYDSANDDIPRSRWVHVTLEADFAPAKGIVKVAFDGKPEIEHDGLPFQEVTGALQLTLGLVRNNAPTPAMDMRFDNLVIRTP